MHENKLVPGASQRTLFFVLVGHSGHRDYYGVSVHVYHGV